MKSSECDENFAFGQDGPVLERAELLANRFSSSMASTVALGAGCFWGTEKFCTRSKSLLDIVGVDKCFRKFYPLRRKRLT